MWAAVSRAIQGQILTGQPGTTLEIADEQPGVCPPARVRGLMGAPPA
jgi:hypothetical protein